MIGAEVRVDFVDTALLPPTRGECRDQRLTVTGPVWQSGLPAFCGANHGQGLITNIVTPRTDWIVG